MLTNEILNKINSPRDLSELNKDDLLKLCDEIRAEMIDVISKNGGHLASNLGMVELTIAMHRFFDSPNDKFVFDVGHQCYTHKLLTGRRELFDTLRKENGISGFTRPTESEHDIFASGHSSTSISAALGLAAANALSGDDHYVVAVIGDGALSGGLAYEALNNAGRMRNIKLIVILNDNKMSISKNVGAMARHLAVIRSHVSYYNFKNGIEVFLQKIPLIGKFLRNFVFRVKKSIKSLVYNSNIFEDMGFYYLGPIDGHNIDVLEKSFETAKKLNRPVVIHVHTVKGKGYSFAEQHPSEYHGVSPHMDIDTGEQIALKDSFSGFAGNTLCKIAAENDHICAITAAMSEGTGLFEFSQKYKDRFFDVGIAEAHAVTFSGGLAKGGYIPFFVVYSSFLQRGYDQLIHDIALQNVKSIILIDRAGFVGADGESHQGLFDVAFFNSIPNTVVYSPSYFDELEYCINKAIQSERKSLFAIRYPKGDQPENDGRYQFNGRDFCLCKASAKDAEIAIITYGRVFASALKAQEKLASQNIFVDIIKLTRIHPISLKIVNLAAEYKKLYFFEESIKSGGIGEHFCSLLSETDFNGSYKITAVDDTFVAAASIENSMKKYHLDADSITKIIIEE